MRRPLLSAACVLVCLAGCHRPAPAPTPLHADIVLHAEAQVIEARVPPHATLETLLRGHQLSSDLVAAAVDSARAVFNLRQIRADRPYRLVLSLDGMLREFEYQIDADRFLRIISRNKRKPAALHAEVLPYEKETSVVAIRGRIDADHSSVIAAMDETGENIQLALTLADIFSGQIDFDSDLQPGDSFEVLFEKSMRDGQFAGYGDVIGARFVADGREHQAFRWVSRESGKAAYYDENGRSLKRFMLRTPLRFQPRVTSGFSRNRLHPVYRTYRAHLGVDYGAPTGSPVVAVANGVVASAGWAGGGGNQIRLRHSGGIETYYLHLSRFARGIRAGAHVAQGEVIGFVGATGTATGPHLDYRLRKNGVFVNPLQFHRSQPAGEPIAAAHLAAFRTSRDGVLSQLSTTLLAEGPQRKPDAVKAVR
jgi:murein DD-endopeptidase MepM/ murein hydrolase activator NlpD